MILFEQAEALLNDDERKALSDAETTFSRIVEAKTKQYEGDVPPIEKKLLWEKTLDNIPGAREALQIKFEKAKLLWSASQVKDSVSH